MIIVDKGLLQFNLDLPVNFTKSSKNYHLLLRNTVSHKQYSWDIEDSNSGPWSYSFVVNLDNDLPLGEYEYQIKDDSFRIVATGLLRVQQEDTPRMILENPLEFETYENTAGGMVYTETLN